jgi:hypothetical protein
VAFVYCWTPLAPDSIRIAAAREASDPKIVFSAVVRWDSDSLPSRSCRICAIVAMSLNCPLDLTKLMPSSSMAPLALSVDGTSR